MSICAASKLALYPPTLHDAGGRAPHSLRECSSFDCVKTSTHSASRMLEFPFVKGRRIRFVDATSFDCVKTRASDCAGCYEFRSNVSHSPKTRAKLHLPSTRAPHSLRECSSFDRIILIRSKLALNCTCQHQRARTPSGSEPARQSTERRHSKRQRAVEPSGDL